MANHALIVLSGGQDSTLCMAWAKELYNEVSAVSFDYGQRHKLELEAAREIANFFGVTDHKIIDLTAIDSLFQSNALTEEGIKVEEYSKDAIGNVINPSTFVPFRNPLFMSLAVSRALAIGADTVVTGITSADFAKTTRISWEWAAGYYDIEHYFSYIRGANSVKKPVISTQFSDPSLIAKLNELFQTVGISLVSNQLRESLWRVDVVGKADCSSLWYNIGPYLQSKKFIQAMEGPIGFPCVARKSVSIAYAAGLLEVAGHISTRTYKAKYGNETYPLIQLSFRHDDGDVLKKVAQELVGDDKTAHSQPRFNPMCSRYEISVLDGINNRTVLSKIFPHLATTRLIKALSESYHSTGANFECFEPPYRDCTPDFLSDFQKMVNQSLPKENSIQIRAPLLYLTKAHALALALKLPGAYQALALSRTAYSGEYPPKTQDHASVLRAKAFEEANIPDPMIVTAHMDGLMDLPDTKNYEIVRAQKPKSIKSLAEKLGFETC